MRLCHRDEIVQRLSSGHLVMERQSGEPVEFVDEFRIGLHLREIGEVTGPVSVARPTECRITRLGLDSCRLRAGGFYLAITDEILTWPCDMLASIHTRSTYARIGLEFLSSADVVVPGFGSSAPSPLVLEIRPALDVYGLSTTMAYAFLLAYVLDRPRATPPTSLYAAKFPLGVLSHSLGEEEG
jgi:hypothetical protein